MPTPVMPISALSEGETVAVRVDGVDVLLGCIEGQFYAVQAHCTHAHQALATGRLRGFEITCPLHSARFDVRTGACTAAPAQQALQTFPVMVEGGKVCIEVH